MTETFDKPRLLKMDLWISSLGEVIGWYERMFYMGHTLKRQDTGWFLVVRAKRKGDSLVCYISGADPEACFYLFAYGMRHKELRWKPDKYA